MVSFLLYFILFCEIYDIMLLKIGVNLMNRLLRISFDTLLDSLSPILMWILLGQIINKNIASIFVITYSFQFVVSLVVAIFGTGPNVTTEKKKINGIIDSNIMLGSITIFLIVLLFSLNVDSYIEFMHLNPSIYREYTFYSFILMFFQAVLKMVCEKLYFKEENKKANKLTLLFNISNLVLIVISSLIAKESISAIIFTSVIDFFLIAYIVLTNLDNLKFKFMIKDNIKYVSNDIFDAIFMFIIYFIGERTVFSFGELYLVADNFLCLITDSQWDMSYAIITAATIDASRDKVDYQKSLKNGKNLILLLIISSIIMCLLLYPIYQPSLWVLAIFFGVQLINLIVSPRIWIRQQYIQINYSAKKNVFHKNAYESIRVVSSFLPTPFCTYIGQFFAMVYEIIVYDIYYNSKFYVKNGYLKMDI